MGQNAYLLNFSALTRATVLLCAALLTACASQPSDPVGRIAYEEANDPLEPLNRSLLDFNSAADGLVLKPVSQIYDGIMPDFGKKTVRNVLNNLGEPVTMINDLLQGEFIRAREAFTRFVFNSTLGVGGAVDIMADVGIKRHDEDFGQTLAVWGVAEGPYLVLPLLGPSSFRDLGGFVVDAYVDPVNRTFRGHDLKSAPYIRTGVDIVDRRASLLGVIEELESGSIDYYTTLRSAYRQRRAQAIRNGKPPPADDLFGEALKEDGGAALADRLGSPVE